MSLFFCSACTSNNNEKEVNRLNNLSYTFHYRDLDSTEYYARKALSLSKEYSTGKAESYNNLAFVHIARMEYDKASLILDSIYNLTNNQLELLISDIQQMRLCQRESKNKNFYDYKERASRRLKRIGEETESLPEHTKKRLIYAKSEFAIVLSTYYYYVGLTREAFNALRKIDPFGDIQKDTAQYLNYLYQVGSGGIISSKYKEDIEQKECEILFNCYMLANKYNLIYWEANSLQSISEHLLASENKNNLLETNTSAIKYLNKDNMPDSLLSGYFAQRSLDLFLNYGDIYQVAGAYRTLSLCYWDIKDYTSALLCLEKSLMDNNLINQAPDLVASIKEQMSLVYSAMDDKKNSDINRNQYLDLQDRTRQDRQLEARAEQLKNTSIQLNILIATIIILIIILTILLFVFNSIRKKKIKNIKINDLLIPLNTWSDFNQNKQKELSDNLEEIKEQLYISYLDIKKNKRRNLDNHAKVFLVSNVMPYIDRIINEIKRLLISNETKSIRDERLIYMSELTDKINDFNDTLTHWIQLQQGQIGLNIESFKLNDIFDILSHSEMSFKLKGLRLIIDPSDCIVKADKVLTLFMLNTLADNARKFTQKGGTIHISAKELNDYVEISVKDTGCGISQEVLSNIFDKKISNGHGFGLMNCKGIIDKYKKISRIFNICGLYAESIKGKGSRFYFRLPYGILRTIISFLLINSTLTCFANKFNIATNKQTKLSQLLIKADEFADSAYYSNINGTYDLTLLYADSTRAYLNKYYKLLKPKSLTLMVKADNGLGIPAEIKWFREGININFNIIMDIRNESAIAALALHQWDLYHYNNKVYTQLFKETSADKSLSEYCITMQRSSTNKTIAVFILIFLLCGIICSYYFLYYKNILFFKFCIEQLQQINDTLLSDSDNSEKLKNINAVNTNKFPKHLQNVVTQIREALKQSITTTTHQEENIELAKDELRRSEYEKERLYICNNIIDNCLSTLKHETMYYPSRIKQLIVNKECDLNVLNEVASYYKELYTILCEQVQKQTEHMGFECRPISLKSIVGINEYILGDEELILYLFDLIKKTCKTDIKDISLFKKEKQYITLSINCKNILLTENQCNTLFTPATKNIPFLICRHIVRETGEYANLHGCGIVAEITNEQTLILKIILPRFLKKDLKIK